MTTPVYTPGISDIVQFLSSAEAVRRMVDFHWSEETAGSMAFAAFSMLSQAGLIRSGLPLSSAKPDILYSSLFLQSGLPGNSDTDVLSFNDLVSQRPTGASLAQLLIELGVNPWGQGTKLPPSVDLATSIGSVGFILKAVAMPSAPPVEKLYAMETAQNGTFLQHLAYHPSAGMVLAKLSELHKSQVPPDLITQAMCVAQPRSVDMLLGMSSEGLTPSQVKKIKKAWVVRMSGGNLDKGKISSMLARLDPNAEERASDLVSSSDIAKLLSTDWFNIDGSSFNRWVLPIPQFDRDFLCGKFSHKTGSLSGTWTGLAANCMARIRHSSTDSSAQTNISKWMGNSPRDNGTLSSAMGVHWREGISLDGVVWLAMFGQEKFSTSSNEMEDFQRLTGIQDMDQWSVNSVDHAMEFTRKVLNKNGINPQIALTKAWCAALNKCPAALEYVQSWPISKKQDLLYCLSSDLVVPQSIYGHNKNSFKTLVELMYENQDMKNLKSKVVSQAEFGGYSDPMLAPVLSLALINETAMELDATAEDHLKSKLNNTQEYSAKTLYKFLSGVLEHDHGCPSPEFVQLMDVWSTTTLSLSKKNDLPNITGLARQAQSWVKVHKLNRVASKSQSRQASRPAM